MNDRTQEMTTADLASKAGDARRRNPADLTSKTGDARSRDEEARARMRQDDDLSNRPAPADEEAMAPLFREQDLRELKDRWSTIQTGFVDEPRRAVEEADGLVAATIGRLAESFADERTHLEGQWVRGDDVSTEDLRLALRRYRSFFDRLLSV